MTNRVVEDDSSIINLYRKLNTSLWILSEDTTLYHGNVCIMNAYPSSTVHPRV